MSYIEDYTDIFFKQGNITKDVRNEIILFYLPLVKNIVFNLADKIPSGNPGCSLEDFQQDGIFGLIDAIEKFDPTKGAKFKTYAQFRIRGAILDKIRVLSWIPRRIIEANKFLEKIGQDLRKTLKREPTIGELSEQTNIKESKIQRLKEEISFVDIDNDSVNEEISNNHDNNLPDFLIDGSILNPVEKIYLDEIREIIWQKVESLPSKERTVIVLYYLFDLTMLEIGNIMGYTDSRIYQIHTKATILLRGKMQNYNF